MDRPVVIKEFDPVFGDSHYKLCVRLLSRHGRFPVLDVRWFNIQEREFTTRGISFPVASLDKLRSLLLLNLDEVPQLIQQYNKEKRNDA